MGVFDPTHVGGYGKIKTVVNIRAGSFGVVDCPPMVVVACGKTFGKKLARYWQFRFDNSVVKNDLLKSSGHGVVHG